jgi:hypothetical protein
MEGCLCVCLCVSVKCELMTVVNVGEKLFVGLLVSNGVSPHQVLLNAKIDFFQHDDAGSARSFSGCRQVPRGRIHQRQFSVMVPIYPSFSVGSVSCFVGSVHGHAFGGFSIWRAVFVSVLLVFMFPF